MSKIYEFPRPPTPTVGTLSRRQLRDHVNFARRMHKRTRDWTFAAEALVRNLRLSADCGLQDPDVTLQQLLRGEIECPAPLLRALSSMIGEGAP